MFDYVKLFIIRRKISMAVIAILLFVWLLSNTTFIILSGSTNTCKSCHIMQPYINEWKSSVHKNISCVTCHKLGFNYITRMSFEIATGFYNPHPRAVVSDKICIKCHTMEELNKPIFYKNMVYFNHSLHVGKDVREMLLSCETCHPHVTHGTEQKTTDEDACISCHFIGAPRGEAVTGCPSCHGSPTKTVDFNGMEFNHSSYLTKGMQCNQCHLDVIKGTGKVPKARCHKCHEDRSYKYDNPMFVHYTHVTKEHLTCNNCHKPMVHGEIHMIQALESNCKDCHQSKHNYQRQMYMGIGAKDTPNTPDAMFSTQVSCEGCHPKKSSSLHNIRLARKENLQQTAMACVECHGKPYDRLMYNWISVGNSMNVYASNTINKAKIIIRNSGASKVKKDQAQRLIDDAEFNTRFVSNAYPSHNIRYTQQILMNSLKLANKAAKIVGGPEAEANVPASLKSVGASCAVLCHNTLGMPETIRFDPLGVNFPHDFHISMGLGCDACHPADHAMAMNIKVDTCAQCHHQNSATSNCVLCHSDTAKLFNGRVPFKDIPHTPNVMAGSVSCHDCHGTIKTGHVYQTVRGRCVGCHVPMYGGLLDKWNNVYAKKYETVELLLKNTKITLEGLDKKSNKYKQMKHRYDDASTKLLFIEKANGLHNMSVTEGLFDSAIKELK
ncbi:MAG: hypothetical protein M1381_04055 [Deltaproteobacteria bacterium]|nr:hypothetical protein [Deltaproteobacteria bacterium]MCL5792779.1 hypothetical protein [Deltaproteobacteria bacterium]